MCALHFQVTCGMELPEQVVKGLLAIIDAGVLNCGHSTKIVTGKIVALISDDPIKGHDRQCARVRSRASALQID